MNDFKPTLSVDATNVLDEIKYPKMASMKLDGIRCIFHPIKGMISRSLKPIQNKRLQIKFKSILLIAQKEGIIFDGELYAHNLIFQEITSCVMSHDTMVNVREIEFHCFEAVNKDTKDSTFIERYANIGYHLSENKNVVIVEQTSVNSIEEVNKQFKVALDTGYEGLILRDKDSPYKFGRSTLKQEWMLKVKPFLTFDAKIIDVEQATVVDPQAEKTTNELGRSVTSKKKDDRLLIEKAAAFIVEYEGHRLKVCIAQTDEQKFEIWENKGSYIGRIIEYKGMLVGAKDVPRHPIFLRYRTDRDEPVTDKTGVLNKWIK